MNELKTPINVTGKADVEKWLNIHQMYAIRDADRLEQIEDRVRVLETPWWKRWLARRRYERWARRLKRAYEA